MNSCRLVNVKSDVYWVTTSATAFTGSAHAVPMLSVACTCCHGIGARCLYIKYNGRILESKFTVSDSLVHAALPRFTPQYCHVYSFVCGKKFQVLTASLSDWTNVLELKKTTLATSL